MSPHQKLRPCHGGNLVFRMGLLTAVCIAAAAASMVRAIPPSYVLEVTHQCSSTPSGESQVDILTDLSVVVRVECLTGSIIVPSSDKVNYHFSASYQGDARTQCIFKRRKNSGAYVLLVTVAWSEPKETFKVMKEQYLVTCTLAPHAFNQTRQHETEDGLLAPLELQERQGNKSTSTFTLDITDIAGNPLQTHIDIGRKIQLRSEMTARDGDIGFRAVSCNAVAGNYTYAVLRGGCGDGIVFPRDMGFTTYHNKIISPFFEAFKLKEEDYLLFKCNFTTCKQLCDGDSCTHEARRRRDTTHIAARPSLTLSSDKVQLVSPPGEELLSREVRIQTESLRQAGLETVSATCTHTDQGLVCETVGEVAELQPNHDYYSLLAVSLLLVQAAVSVCMLVAMVLSGSRTRNTQPAVCST